MSSTTSKRETAAEISKRYGLADLVRARMMSRRLYINALARRASISFQDSLDVLDPEYSPLDVPPLHPRRYFYLSDPATARRNLPTLEARYLYNRRLAELETERLEAEERADRLISRHLTRSRVKRAATDKDNEDDNNEENSNEQANKDDEDVEEELYGDALELAYLDLVAPSYDSATWPHARRLYRRKLYPYHFRPLGCTTRLMEKRLREQTPSTN